MYRWITWVWQALIGLGTLQFPFPEPVARARPVELTDEAVSAAFREIVEREWGRRVVLR
jgi:hypothetical protein